MTTPFQLASIGLFSVFAACSGCGPLPDEPAADSDAPAAQSPEETVLARRGVGKQGKGLEGQEGMFVTPVKILFETRQRVVFEIQIPQALALYQAEHGHWPKTEEEFMDKIVKFNGLELPELPVGHEYVYDPDQGQLMVRRPVESPATK